MFENTVSSIVKLRDKFRDQLMRLEAGDPIDVKEWKIVDFDKHLGN